MTSKLKFLISFVLLFVLSACRGDQKDDVLVVGISADNPPYEFMKDGEIVGFDIDFITELAKHLDKKVELKNMEFHSLLAALSSKHVDLVISGLSITDERQKQVDFSVPYTSAIVAVLYRKEDGFQQYEDMEKKKVGAQLGSIFSLIAHNLAAKCQCEVSSLASNLMLIEELKSKRLDAIILEEAQAKKFIEMYPYLARFSLKEFSSSFAIAMPKGSLLRKNIDDSIKILKDNGTLDALEKRWGIVGAD